MTTTSTQVDRQVIQRLLAAAGTSGQAGQADVEAVDYDWTVPHCFVPAGLARLNELARKAARGISRVLGGLLRAEQELVPVGVTEHYGHELLAASSETKQYWSELTCDGRSCGVAGLPARLALSWVTRLLGGEDTGQGGERELTSLESALLSDVVSAIVEAFTAVAWRGQEGPACGRGISAGEYPLGGDKMRPYCKFAFAPAGSSEEPGMELIVQADLLAAATGAKPARGRESDADVRKVLLSHLECMPVVATAWVGGVEIAARDIMDMEVGDVVLIGKTIDEPMELSVRGKVVLLGTAVQCQGKYGLKIAGPAAGRTRAG